MSNASANTSENPLTLAFWIGDVDPRPAAICRIAIGLTLLHFLANLFPDVSAFFSDSGILPRNAADARIVVGLFSLTGNPALVMAIYVAGFLSVLAFTLGLRTRFATIASWIFITSLHRRNPYIVDGGDELVRNLLFFAMFTDMGRAYSLDVASGRKMFAPVAALGVRFLGLHVALLYLLTGYMKARNGWITSNPIFAGFQLTGFLRPPGAFLLDWPQVCRAFGLITLVFEIGFVFAAFSPIRISFSRALAVFMGISVQLGILVTMRVGIFTETMMAGALVFIMPEWLDRLSNKFSSHPSKVARVSGANHAIAATSRNMRWRWVAFAYLSLHSLVFLGWGPLSGRVPVPPLRNWETRLLSLQQSTNLFTDNDPVPRWESPGLTVQGDSVDVIAATKPGIVSAAPGWRMSRWYKLNFHSRNPGFPFQGIGDYLCRDYNEHHAPHLQSFSIVETHTPPRQPSEAPHPTERRLALQMTCPAIPGAD